MIDRLLDLLSLILTGTTYKPLGAPANTSRADTTTARDLVATQVCQPTFYHLPLT